MLLVWCITNAYIKVFSESVNFYYSSKYPLGTPNDKTEVKLYLNKTTKKKQYYNFLLHPKHCMHKHTNTNHTGK